MLASSVDMAVEVAVGRTPVLRGSDGETLDR